MLETEIKKLTKALEDNTAALLGGGTNAETVEAEPTPTTPVSAPTPPIPPLAAPAPAAIPQPVATTPAIPPIPTAGPAAVVPVTPPAPAQPVVPGTPQMTHQQAQAELGSVVQSLGDGAQVQATMRQYGSTRLNEIPVENLFSLVQACKALVLQ